ARGRVWSRATRSSRPRESRCRDPGSQPAPRSLRLAPESCERSFAPASSRETFRAPGCRRGSARPARSGRALTTVDQEQFGALQRADDFVEESRADVAVDQAMIETA